MPQSPSPTAPALDVDVTAVEALGFSVQAHVSEHSANVPYLLTGPRGARYSLWRNQGTPHLLFVVNDKGFTKTASVKGYTWFSDKGGKLTPIRYSIALRYRRKLFHHV